MAEPAVNTSFPPDDSPEDRGHGQGLRFATERPQGQDPSDAFTASYVPLAADARPDEILATIRSFLADGRVLTARRVIADAAARFPDHAEIQAAERALSQDGDAQIRPGNGADTSEEYEWLRNPPEWARGQWVALIGRKAVASAATLAELVDRIKPLDLPRQPLVHRLT